MTSDCAIILCTKNGENFLTEQLKSLEEQCQNFDLYINDDGSSDKTEEIIKNFQKKTKIKIIYTKKNYDSATKNFLKTLKSIKNKYDYYFFCDQDDIWDKKKIEISKIKLDSFQQDIPSLFCSSTEIINPKSKIIDSSKIFKRKPCFSNALVQSIAGGNTMSFNHETKLLLDKIVSIDSVVSHDWITYILVTAHGGKVSYSSIPLVKYRKHENNLIGPNKSLNEIFFRIYLLSKGQMRDWTKKNLRVLNEFGLTRNSEKILNRFEKEAHNGNFFERLKYTIRSDVFRQTYLSNVALHFAILLKKI
tara:strand:- start:1645 stop:2559 length:915 start_codon:yes stop_codon:yes gene_type:complete